VLRSGRGNVSVGIGTGDVAQDDAALARLESELSYRVVAGSAIELLIPGRDSRLVETKRGTVRRRADASDAIEIEAQPAN
jgi:hypothetical protein